MLCEFHRERACDRWLRKKENGVSDRKGTLRLLRKLAHATSQDEYDRAFTDLTNSHHWQNPKLRNYMVSQWLPVAEKWPKFNRTKHSMVVTSNNGTEVQNKVLKEYYRKSRRGRQSFLSLVS